MTLEQIEIKLPESILDLPLSRYLEVVKITEKLTKMEPEKVSEYFSSIEGSIDILDLISLIIGEDADGIPVKYIEEITEKVIDLIMQDGLPQWQPTFEINNILYATRNINNLNEVDAGEMISIKTYQSNMNNDFYQYAPYVAAILIRPTQEVVDEETGEKRIEIQPFSRKDIQNLEWRAELFKNTETRLILPTLTFFLTGKK